MEIYSRMTITTSLGKRLADTDPVSRNRSLKKLATDMNSAEVKPETLEDFQRVWRSLWYGLWMADKRPVQTQVAVQAVSMGTNLTDDQYVLWTRAFFLILIDMWPRLDRHRMDKYLLLLRVFIAELFRRERLSGWNSDFITSLSAEIINGGAKCLGVALHVMRVWWEELDAEIKRSDNKVDNKVITKLMETPLHFALTSDTESLIRRVCDDVLLKTEYMPKSLLRTMSKQLSARGRETEVCQEVREILFQTAESLLA